MFCRSTFATNRELPDLPVGRRIAFDPHRYRLWVVCKRCLAWCLTPFDRRIETVDRCEEIWQSAKRLDTTPGIGLTRTASGLELLRIGVEDRAEFACWRYGTRFKHRQWIRGIQLGIGIGGAGLALVHMLTAWGLLLTGYALFFLHAHLRRFLSRPVLRVPAAGGPHPLSRKDLRRITLRRGKRARVAVSVRGGPLWRGADAWVALMLIMPRINRGGGSRRHRREAIALLESLNDPLEMLSFAAEKWPGRRVHQLPLLARLALEMAANEQAERDAMEERLQRLVEAWDEAEETAAIADSLLLPDWVDNLIRSGRAIGRCFQTECSPRHQMTTKATSRATGRRSNQGAYEHANRGW